MAYQSPDLLVPTDPIPGCECLPEIPGVFIKVAHEGYHTVEQTSLPHRLSLMINLQEIERSLNIPVVTIEGDTVDIILDVSGNICICQGINKKSIDRCDTSNLLEPCCLVSRDELNGEIVRTMILERNREIIELHMFEIQAINFEGSAELYTSREPKITAPLNASVA